MDYNKIFRGEKKMIYGAQPEIITYLEDNLICEKPVRGNKLIHLTFDDGPTRYLPEFLDVLKCHDARATFFLCGSMINGDREQWLVRALSEGHSIGNHTMTHPRLSELSHDEQYSEIYDANKIIYASTNHRVVIFRPPYGDFDLETVKVLAELKMKLIYWSIEAKDSREIDVQSILDNILTQLHDGAIILMHERPTTLKALPLLIEAVKAEGYSFGVL